MVLTTFTFMLLAGAFNQSNLQLTSINGADNIHSRALQYGQKKYYHQMFHIN